MGCAHTPGSCPLNMGVGDRAVQWLLKTPFPCFHTPNQWVSASSAYRWGTTVQSVLGSPGLVGTVKGSGAGL